MKSKKKLDKQIHRLIDIIVYLIKPTYSNYTSTMSNKTFKYFYGKR